MRILEDLVVTAGLEEVWIALIYRQLEATIQKHTDKMNQIAHKGDTQQVAWHARNLLELWIYSEFCAQKRENAIRFFKDVVRDIIDMNKKHPDELSAEYHRTIEIAKERLKIDEPSHRYTTVDEAAENTGLKEAYDHSKKPLHKYVHTSALSVAAAAFMGDPKLTRGEFVRLGNEYSEAASKALRTSYMFALREKYKHRMDQELKRGQWSKRISG